jgi:hypothetical protein
MIDELDLMHVNGEKHYYEVAQIFFLAKRTNKKLTSGAHAVRHLGWVQLPDC